MEPEIILPRRGQDLRVDLAGANILERGDEASLKVNKFTTRYLLGVVNAVRGMVRCGHTSRGSLKTPDENAIAVARIYVVSCIVNVRVVIA
ncbi:carbonic anhydrase family protein [Aspergillus luchuensis]|uniref:Carbonic anhydrase family protein n=1 Tax=Aspergillus kawachii TaxID=1069201 RepID=A0A146F2M1_ASPKA|nr:carbonic anhydrase family protein [Aspergillus luchuensis]